MNKKMISVAMTTMVTASLISACSPTAEHVSLKDTKNEVTTAPSTIVETAPKKAYAADNLISSGSELPKPQEQTVNQQKAEQAPSPKTESSNQNTQGQNQQNEPKKITTPTQSTDSLKAPLSWYYMKKGKGHVPDFPKETKSYSADQKAVWVGSGKTVYLTFDNGGPMGDTDKLLKTLKDNNVKATFFIAGYNLKAHPDFFKKLVADGHLVANHSMSHKILTNLPMIKL